MDFGWVEEIRDCKFPYAVNSEVEARSILFNNTPARLVLLKWVYTLTSGFLNDISPRGEFSFSFVSQNLLTFLEVF